jgi:hypothetical protein
MCCLHFKHRGVSQGRIQQDADGKQNPLLVAVTNCVQAGGWKVAEFKGNAAPEWPSVETNKFIMGLISNTRRRESGSSVNGTEFMSVLSQRSEYRVLLMG